MNRQVGESERQAYAARCFGIRNSMRIKMLGHRTTGGGSRWGSRRLRGPADSAAAAPSRGLGLVVGAVLRDQPQGAARTVVVLGYLIRALPLVPQGAQEP